MDTHRDDRRTGANRLGLGVAVALTAGVIGAGTWLLGSGSDPAEPGPAPALGEIETGDRARPPVSVAPPPADVDRRGTGGSAGSH